MSDPLAPPAADMTGSTRSGTVADMVPKGLDDASVVGLLAKLTLIPDSARGFSLPVSEVERRFRLTPEVLDYLVARGLPTRHRDGGPHFDYLDIRNTALQLGFGPAAQAARRFWSAGLNAPAGRPTRYEIYYQGACPDRGHAPICHYRIAAPGGRPARVSLPAGHTGALLTVEVSLDNDWQPFPAEWREVLHLMDDLDFMYLPRALRLDLDFVRQTGLCDCVGGAEIIVREGRRRGLPVRRSHGLIMTPPYSTRHDWAEFLVDGRWMPVDPLLVRSMTRWGMLDPAAWPIHRSPGAILVRLTPHRQPLVTHDGTDVPVIMLTRRLPSRP